MSGFLDRKIEIVDFDIINDIASIKFIGNQGAIRTIFITRYTFKKLIGIKPGTMNNDIDPNKIQLEFMAALGTYVKKDYLKWFNAGINSLGIMI